MGCNSQTISVDSHPGTHHHTGGKPDVIIDIVHIQTVVFLEDICGGFDSFV